MEKRGIKILKIKLVEKNKYSKIKKKYLDNKVIGKSIWIISNINILNQVRKK